MKVILNRELSFDQNDLIEIVNRIDQCWYEGVLGKTSGLVPANYVNHKKFFNSLNKLIYLTFIQIRLNENEQHFVTVSIFLKCSFL